MNEQQPFVRHMFLLLHALVLQIVSDLRLWPWVCPLELGSKKVIWVVTIIPREARAEGPSVARLLNLSGRTCIARRLSRANSSEKYLYIYR